MYFVYSLLLTLGVLLLSPLFIWRRGKYTAGLKQRLGGVPEFNTGGRPVIWLHCVSVGETQAARPLAQALLETYPQHALVVSTTTLTGQRLAQEVFSSQAAAVFYFPFDWAWTVRRALRRVRPAAVLIMETEIWPNFLRVCRRENVPVAIVNGRLSEKSARGYSRAKWFIRRILNNLTLAVMQSDADAGRFCSLGLPTEKVRVSGNIKYDLAPAASENGLADALRLRFQIDETRPLIVAASTHAPEEIAVLEAFKILRRTHPQARLLIAPRHPERFREVAELLQNTAFNWSRRSSESQAGDAQADVILLDSIGELRAVYALAQIVLVGGSLAKTGGHNVLEPAAAGVCVLTGAHTFNFTAIINDFVAADALIALPDLPEAETPAQLARVWGELLADGGRRERLTRNARAVLEQNRGATRRTSELLAPILRHE
jgi:3-deoxy-D-manno-octulosonic-acid transferase